MRWFPLECCCIESPLTVEEVRTRLSERSAAGGAIRRPPPLFRGSLSPDGFCLVPVTWGQASFMPRIFGRMRAVPAGTRIDVDVVPNQTLLVLLVVQFAVLALLVYDRQWERVAVMAGANALLAWIVAQSGFWLSVPGAMRHLLKLIEGTRVAPEAATRRPAAARGWRIRRFILPTMVLAGGVALWFAVAEGRTAFSRRPTVDLIWIFWITQGLLAGWLFWLSGIRVASQVKLLAVLFAAELAWSGCVHVEGFAGDGRPIFGWRWQTTPDVLSGREASIPAPGLKVVDLAGAGPHDFPGFRGRNRDGVVRGTLLDADWNRSPPRIVWRRPVGRGWSAFAVAGGFAVTQEQRGDDETVVCYQLSTGRECWVHADRARFAEMMGGDGPRATPTLHAGRVYSLGATGILNCLQGDRGTPVWSVNVLQDVRTANSQFGMAGSPLVWRDLVIVAPGGKLGSLAAYDRDTGRRRWAAGDSPAAYASPQLARFGGREQVLNFNADGLFSHAPEDGRILWSYPWVTPPERNNVCQPVRWIDDAGRETLFLSSGYGHGCTLLEIDRAGEDYSVRSRWQNVNLKAKFTSVVEAAGFLYGLDEAVLVCLDLRTGERRWKGGRYGFGQLLLVEDTLLIVSEAGEVVLCAATPERHHELARIPVLDRRTWNHPALVGNRLLIRNDREAACLELPLR